MDLKTMKFAAELFRGAMDRDSSCCSDIDPKFLDAFGFTDEEKIALAGAYINWNCRDPQDLQKAGFLSADDEGKIQEFYRIPDFGWMGYFAAQLEQGRVFLEFPLRVYPHFGLEESSEVVSDPLELGAAVARGISASPVGKVSLGNV